MGSQHQYFEGNTMDVKEQERDTCIESECINKMNLGFFPSCLQLFIFDSIPSFWNQVCTLYWLNTTRMLMVCVCVMECIRFFFFAYLKQQPFISL